ncbi:MAG: serine/threonine protein kinase [bacterium]|nr:serine/threonine protein kinase [bacterium]
MECLNNRYEVSASDLIDEGGICNIYKGYDKVSKQPVAIKQLKQVYREKEEAKLRLFREFFILNNLKDSHFVKVFEFIEDYDCYVMEYLGGKENTLRQLIDNGGIPSPEEMRYRLGLFQEILSAVHFIHTYKGPIIKYKYQNHKLVQSIIDNNKAGIVHRDLNPRNIMISDDKHIKIIDFGISFFEGHHTLTHVNREMGTNLYMAPETKHISKLYEANSTDLRLRQYEDSAPPELGLIEFTDHRVDIFAMGVILYELLTGRHPTNHEFNYFTNYSKPRVFNKNISKKLDDIICKMACPNRIERYQNTEDIINDIYKKGSANEIFCEDFIKKTHKTNSHKEQYATFGSYPQTKKTDEKLIEWVVLERDDETALLLSRFALDWIPFHTRWESISWNKCALRQWMNDDFIHNAFTKLETEQIIPQRIYTVDELDNKKKGYYTKDKVFLLSAEEIEKYLPDKNNRKCEPTPYAAKRGITTSNENYCWYWLRNVYADKKASNIGTQGDVRKEGFSVNKGLDSTSREKVGFRPAMRVKLDALNIPQNKHE